MTAIGEVARTNEETDFNVREEVYIKHREVLTYQFRYLVGFFVFINDLGHA